MKDFEDFRYKYYENPVRIHSISEFEKANRTSHNNDIRSYMLQTMATIGLEFENRFQDVVFDDDKFILFGREKSKQSVSNKRKIHIADFNEQFNQAIDNNENYVPTKVKPIFDFYAFKLVCPNISNTKGVIDRVVQDILADIKNFYPSEYQKIMSTSPSQEAVIDAIDTKFADKYPGLKGKINTIRGQKKETNAIQDFLDNNSGTDISSLTYKEYYKKIVNCYTILKELAYEESTRELLSIDKKIEEVKKQLEELKTSGNLDSLIPKELHTQYSKDLEKLLEDISYKRTNKLDLSVGDLMLFDVLTTSKALRNLGISCSTDPLRTKEKRTEKRIYCKLLWAKYVRGIYG